MHHEGTARPGGPLTYEIPPEPMLADPDERAGDSR